MLIILVNVRQTASRKFIWLWLISTRVGGHMHEWILKRPLLERVAWTILHEFHNNETYFNNINSRKYDNRTTANNFLFDDRTDAFLPSTISKMSAVKTCTALTLTVRTGQDRGSQIRHKYAHWIYCSVINAVYLLANTIIFLPVVKDKKYATF